MGGYAWISPVFLIRESSSFSWSVVLLFLPRAQHLVGGQQAGLCRRGRELFKNRPLLGCWLATWAAVSARMFVTFSR
jgi:hypothetical protein